MALAGLLVACEYSELDGVGTRTPDEDFPPQLDVVAFEGCQGASLNQVRATGEVVNNSPSTATYEVIVAFLDADQTRLDEKSTWIRDLRPDERAAVDHTWWIDGRDLFATCEVLIVNRWS